MDRLAALRIQVGGLTFGFGGKYIGSRFATDNNDYKVPSYFTADAESATTWAASAGTTPISR